jgi:hypothetical protein
MVLVVGSGLPVLKMCGFPASVRASLVLQGGRVVEVPPVAAY